MTADQVVAVVAAGFALLGTVFVLIGLLRRRMTRAWQPTRGTVVTRDGSVHGLPSGYPTVQWQDTAGRTHRRTSIVRQSFPPRLGTTVPVLYDPDRPDRGVMDTAVQRGTVFVAVGAGLLVIALLLGALATYVAVAL
ncbi:uncharacterized protein DUF3592 [Mumia flava]|uniref:Uncharacterized protein DUF3592 n=1 Tax=Mumia flava TaxID=1348852 RepID=A0A0B2B7K9_9ACTN|nr:DUF3592 domain-containing protein [Mumia flava]PJJ56697.1 uncharacterized protein DUF3592 [Mumia flava]